MLMFAVSSVKLKSITTLHRTTMKWKSPFASPYLNMTAVSSFCRVFLFFLYVFFICRVPPFSCVYTKTHALSCKLLARVFQTWSLKFQILITRYLFSFPIYVLSLSYVKFHFLDWKCRFEEQRSSIRHFDDTCSSWKFHPTFYVLI